MEFNAKPPFEITRLARKPIFVPDAVARGKGDYPNVVFPCGAVHDDGQWLVSAGLYDEQIVILAFTEAEIERALSNQSKHMITLALPPALWCARRTGRRPLSTCGSAIA